jgi:phosphatidylglycerol:prolipoprotein diacylglycerol transferase
VYPELFRIPFIDYPISTFGVSMATAFLVAFWITMKGMEEKRMATEELSAVFIYVMLGGIIGSKMYYAIDNWLLNGGPFLPLLLSRGGITWYGGLIGGTVAGAIGAKRVGINVKQLADCVAPGVAVGQAIGRIGCFLVGDDYGRVSDVPWAVAFPEGAPPTLERVHPTQLYEVAWLLPVALLLWSRRHKSPFLFGEYMALNGAGRIVIENWRVNPTVALGMTEPQWIGFGLIVLGVGGWIYYKFHPPQTI